MFILLILYLPVLKCKLDEFKDFCWFLSFFYFHITNACSSYTHINNKSIVECIHEWMYEVLFLHKIFFALILLFFYLLKDFYLFIWQREITSRQRGRQRETEEEQAPCWAESPMRDFIPGPWDHDLSRRQRLNPLNHPGAPGIFLNKAKLI